MDLHNVEIQQVLDQISRHCPESLSVYLHCYNRMNEDRGIYFSRDLIENVLSEDFRSFRNNIKKLAREDLLEWHMFDEGIAVTLRDTSHDE